MPAAMGMSGSAPRRRRRAFRRVLRAQMRDFRVLLLETRVPLLIFAVVVVAGGVVLRLAYRFPGSARGLDLGESLFAAFALAFFEVVLPFPEAWLLRGLFLAIPLIGLTAAAEGVIRFGSALLDKRARGQKWESSTASTFSDHVIVCGLGKVGFRVVVELLKFEREVVAIERNPDCHFIEKARAAGIPIITADARRSANLLKAGVARAQAVIPCTDDELANLDIALDAREINPDIKVVMRMFDSDLARRVQKGFGIHTAFSTSALAAPVFATAASGLNVKHSFYVGDDLLNVCELIVAPGSSLEGWTVGKVGSTFDVSVVLYQDGQVTDLHPLPELELREGVKVLVLATLEQLRELNRLNEGVLSTS